MTNQPNKATVKDGLPTAEEATMVAMESAYKKEKSVGNILDINSAVAFKLGWGHAIQHTSLHTQPLRERVKELEELMQEFIDRVDRGEVRSKRTYAKFKEALKK